MSSINRYKEVEAMLYNHKQNKATIINIEYEILEVQLNYQGVGSIDYSRERSGQTNKISNSIEDEVIRREHEVERLERKKKMLELKELKLESALNALDERDRNIISKRYFEGYSNKQVARQMYISEQYFCDIKRKIIGKLVKMIFNRDCV